MKVDLYDKRGQRLTVYDENGEYKLDAGSSVMCTLDVEDRARLMDQLSPPHGVDGGAFVSDQNVVMLTRPSAGILAFAKAYCSPLSTAHVSLVVFEVNAQFIADLKAALDDLSQVVQDAERRARIARLRRDRQRIEAELQELGGDE